MSASLRLAGHAKDLGGGFKVRRLLPAVQRQAVGPFLFFDHFGPVMVEPGAGHDVRPHPHIGLATVTYLFSGAIMHRDSLGYVQQIDPGAINWMTAGRGIVHSERRPESLANQSFVNHGIQLWAALPQAHEEAEPSFVHTPSAAIPAGPQNKKKTPGPQKAQKAQIRMADQPRLEFDVAVIELQGRRPVLVPVRYGFAHLQRAIAAGAPQAVIDES